ncbi:MAG: FliG C-terminal domain-containing protein [Bdellovibrionales bacterium]
MSTLKRYRKPGGFKQLLILLETSPATKKEQLLKIVAAEDKRWAGELEKRILTMNKILSWKIEVVEKIMQLIPEQTWPKALFHLSPDDRQKLFVQLIQFLPQTRQKQMNESLAGLAPTPGEIEAAHLLIIKKVREMQANGDLKLEQFDANLNLDGIDKVLM